MIRIFIADDHAMVRGGLKQIIATCSDMQVVGEATDGNTLLDGLQQGACDLLLLDMTMPGLSGIDLIQQLRKGHPSLPVLILSMHNEGQFVARALKAGASGYVTKGSEPEVLLAAIRKIAAGGRFIDPSLVDAMVFESPAAGGLPHESLSERELQILKLIAAGLPLGRIADQLHLSPKTVSTYKMRLMDKLGIDNNADLIRYASRHELAP
ncbi:MAG TPA: response regulator transcription factor [Azospira sp.]|nr:response regulator transcription factor [Azospira sp.]HNN08803.1 response regulator transcription factor [Azospira sp.]HNN45941.1 response regulator transcription factor [Azospira sp.]